MNIRDIKESHEHLLSIACILRDTMHMHMSAESLELLDKRIDEALDANQGWRECEYRQWQREQLI